ncbi:MFS transporter [Paenibacillus herberti]|uniref:MFS transporter n=1 Tax=Paenibacillus herberti TaxID=1619309 RepID=A0A229NXG6_9BACL|nr:MFS transporter [Paenibacillus herberti]OXM14622.1 MFS transporter [Paenibacillus herberti]
MRKLILLGCLSYFVIGLAHVVAGALLEPVMANYKLDYGSAGQWITNQFLGFLAGVLAAPALSSRIGRRSTLVLALGALTAAEAVYSVLPPWEIILLVAPVAGFGFGMAEAVVGALVMDVFSKRKASVMGWLEVAFGAGALVMPGVAALLIQDGIWQMSFPVLTALAGISMLLWMTLSFGKADEAVAYMPKRAYKPGTDEEGAGPGVAGRLDGQGSNVGETVPGAVSGTDGQGSNVGGAVPGAASGTDGQGSDVGGTVPGAAGSGWLGYKKGAWPVLAVGMLFFFLYVGMEMVIANYLPSIMTNQSGLPEAEASAVLSLFWGMMVAGRLMIGLFTRAAGYRIYLLGSVGASLVMMVLLAGADTLSWTLVLVGLAGFCLAGIFAVALIYVNERLPGMTDRTTSLLVACGGLGGAIFPKLGGWLLDLYGWQRLLQMTAVMAALLLLLLLALLALRDRRETAVR